MWQSPPVLANMSRFRLSVTFILVLNFVVMIGRVFAAAQPFTAGVPQLVEEKPQGGPSDNRFCNPISRLPLVVRGLPETKTAIRVGVRNGLSITFE